MCVFLSFSLSDGGGVCAGGLSVRMSAAVGGSGSREPLLYGGVPRSQEKSGSVLPHAGGCPALGPRHPSAERPRGQHEPEGKAGPISFSRTKCRVLLINTCPLWIIAIYSVENRFGFLSDHLPQIHL